MLKKLSKLFLGLVVCAGSACVTPTHASSAPTVILAYIQASGKAKAKDELIVLHNNTSVEVDVTDWCLINKANKEFACLRATPAQRVEAGGDIRYILPPYGNLTVASEDHVNASGYSRQAYSFIYAVTNQQSGSIVNGGDSISLIDAEGEVVDTKSWVTDIPTDKALHRMLLIDPIIYAVGSGDADWLLPAQRIDFFESDVVSVVYEFPEAPEEVEGDSDDSSTGGLVDGPGGSSDGSSDGDSNGGSHTNPAALLPPIITELLPNPAGVDTGKEFIELYNPNLNNSMTLDTYRLRIGQNNPKWVTFPEGAQLLPGEYRIFTNADMGFTLVNTAGYLQLFEGDSARGDPIQYTAAKDDMVWALIDGQWQYSKHATPGAENTLAADGGEVKKAAATEKTLKPCAENQFRNPETGRCKLLSSASTSLAPCKAGQERNPATNRCRTVATAVKTLTPCKEGQERNPETNRCRNIVKMSTAGHGVKGAVTEGAVRVSWYYVAGIGLVVVSILSYAVWEWRVEILSGWVRLRGLFVKRAR